jgi:large subunit ribosomal protein L18
MNVKKQARIRRARRTRAKISELGVNRLCVYRTPRHIYAQVIAPTGDVVVVSASTVEKELRGTATGNIEAAGKIGALGLRNHTARIDDGRQRYCRRLYSGSDP